MIATFCSFIFAGLLRAMGGLDYNDSPKKLCFIEGGGHLEEA